MLGRVGRSAEGSEAGGSHRLLIGEPSFSHRVLCGAHPSLTGQHWWRLGLLRHEAKTPPSQSHHKQTRWVLLVLIGLPSFWEMLQSGVAGMANSVPFHLAFILQEDVQDGLYKDALSVSPRVHHSFGLE